MEPYGHPHDNGRDEWERQREAAREQRDSEIAASWQRVHTEGLRADEITSMRAYQVSSGPGGWIVQAHVSWDDRSITVAHGFSSKSLAEACERKLADHLLEHGSIRISTKPGTCNP